MNEDIKLLIKNEYENNGVGVTALSKKYKVSANTINSWKKREKWIKKVAPKGNALKKKKDTKKYIGANEKDIQIKKDILNGVSKDEILEKNKISEATYYNKAKDIRQIRLERTEELTKKIVDEVYEDMPAFLTNIAKAKLNTGIRIIKAVHSKDTDDKEIASLEKKLNLITKTEKEFMRTGKYLTSYEQLEVIKQLAEENISMERLELDKQKANKDNESDKEKEQALVELLKNITEK